MNLVILSNFETTNQTGSISNSSCICEVSYYESKNGDCSSCPEGTKCDSIGFEIEDLEVENGYWRVDGESDSILQCQIQ